MADSGGAGRGTLADKIERLFRIVRKAGSEQHSNEEVAAACREATGESFSATYLWQLRTGRRDNPTKRHLEALANFFDVPVAYFFDDDQGRRIQAELELLGALRNAEVRDIALRAVNLSPDGLGTINDIIDAIAKREAARRSTGSDDETK
ncbi:XRE family transcriptional regulator [Nocardia terpenica]|uniref:Transcriptional regulator n=1 Tax=Nocardia terpenica TaxID=455432 RepID=A0A164HGT9_9NOCA|nr:XRE family transcriptional regulator [Nocardia terpenica]ATL65078.1 transcriptional regulator [Nocardia terpenica]KZM68499.1 XRE family transcriptional regulator [Nocardia terpenica]MBF6064977.1 XRE family transcriptional regulator [Nocardia terpenica]MBF6115249.1 XRE family transcriptional regulator [Nocardia terpenica]MBF6122571.1 XRE family transcriptional regulator [Nocardia terpenica]